MAKFYSGIDTSIGVGSETLDGMLTNGSTYGVSPSQTIDCSNVIVDTNIGIGTTNPTAPLEVHADNTKIFDVASNGLVKGTLHTLIGEHSAATNVGQLFSFGNGATDNQGPAMPFAGEVVVVTISKSGGSDAGTFQPSKNGVTQGSASDQITTTTGSGTVTKNNANYSSLMDFAAGDRINYVTIDATDTTTCLTMLVRFNP
jgi:hypothetical protein